MKAARGGGFTLIELLTVIAIISILAGLTAVALPRALERARIADVQTDFNAIRTALAEYYTEQDTYPPAYGYRLFPMSPTEPVLYNHTPYTTDIGIHRAFNLYDRFSVNYDTDNNGVMTRLEYLPIDLLSLPAPTVAPYGGGSAPTGAFEAEQRPYIYVPYYSKHLERLKREVLRDTNNPAYGTTRYWRGDVWNPDFLGDSPAQQPPSPRYDGYVLISVGPLNDTRGLLTPPGGEQQFLTNSGAPAALWYHVLALRTAYLATRDINGNGLLDFDYLARTRQREGQADPALAEMPDLRTVNTFPAPLIFVP
ncbi:MAG: hypothetical protein AMXMBFR4_16340 [Candidatus Hydrogenedentota bacterium]